MFCSPLAFSRLAECFFSITTLKFLQISSSILKAMCYYDFVLNILQSCQVWIQFLLSSVTFLEKLFVDVFVISVIKVNVINNECSVNPAYCRSINVCLRLVCHEGSLFLLVLFTGGDYRCAKELLVSLILIPFFPKQDLN